MTRLLLHALLVFAPIALYVAWAVLANRKPERWRDGPLVPLLLLGLFLSGGLLIALGTGERLPPEATENYVPQRIEDGRILPPERVPDGD